MTTASRVLSFLGKAWFLTALSLSILIPTSFAQPKVLFLGDSLTEGLNVPRDKTYVALVEENLRSHGFPKIEVVNGGVSGSTSASGLERMNWYKKGNFDVLFLALGANDGLRGLAIQQLEDNLAQIIESAQQNKMLVLLAGMQVPSNYGKAYQRDFANVFAKLAKRYKVALYPFLLAGVALEKQYNQQDGIHPNEKGYQVIAAKLSPWLAKQLANFKIP